MRWNRVGEIVRNGPKSPEVNVGRRQRFARRGVFDRLEARDLPSSFTPLHRDRTVQVATPVSAGGESGTVQRNIVYENVGGRQEKLDVYLPAAPAPPGGRPVILAIHGGGWRKFDKADYGPKVAAQFNPAGYVVIAVNYELSAPGFPSWPANLGDLRNAVLWVRAHAVEFGIDPNRLAALGESAGGHLAALLGTYPDGPLGGPVPAAGAPAPAPDPATHVNAVIDFYGPSDLTTLAAQSPSAGFAAAQFLGGTSNQVPGLYQMASPVSHVAPGDPPFLLIQGTGDQLVPIDQSQELAADLTASGVPNQFISVVGARHGLEFTPRGQKMVPRILAFLATSWKD